MVFRSIILGLWCLLVASPAVAQTPGIAGKYAGDAGIERDPAVLFTEDFESGDLKKWEDRKGPVTLTPDEPHGGKACLAIPMTRGQDTGGHLIKHCRVGLAPPKVRRPRDSDALVGPNTARAENEDALPR